MYFHPASKKKSKRKEIEFLKYMASSQKLYPLPSTVAENQHLFGRLF